MGACTLNCADGGAGIGSGASMRHRRWCQRRAEPPAGEADPQRQGGLSCPSAAASAGGRSLATEIFTDANTGPAPCGSRPRPLEVQQWLVQQAPSAPGHPLAGEGREPASAIAATAAWSSASTARTAACGPAETLCAACCFPPCARLGLADKRAASNAINAVRIKLRRMRGAVGPNPRQRSYARLPKSMLRFGLAITVSGAALSSGESLSPGSR
jgi:hypothetical protein